MWRRPGIWSSVCPMTGRISRTSPLGLTWRLSRMFGRPLPSIRPCEPDIGGPGQFQQFVRQESAVPMSSSDRSRRAAGSSRWTGGHHRDLPRTIASRVVTHGQDGIFRRQIKSRVAPPASSPVFLSTSHPTCARLYNTSSHGPICSERRRRHAGTGSGRHKRRRRAGRSLVEEMGRASVH
jgi:hypothetical protein